MKITCTVSEFCEILRAGLSTSQDANSIYFDLVKNAGIELVQPSPVDNSAMQSQSVGNPSSIMFNHPWKNAVQVSMAEYNELIAKPPELDMTETDQEQLDQCS